MLNNAQNALIIKFIACFADFYGEEINALNTLIIKFIACFADFYDEEINAWNTLIIKFIACFAAFYGVGNFAYGHKKRGSAESQPLLTLNLIP